MENLIPFRAIYNVVPIRAINQGAALYILLIPHRPIHEGDVVQAQPCASKEVVFYSDTVNAEVQAQVVTDALETHVLRQQARQEFNAVRTAFVILGVVINFVVARAPRELVDVVTRSACKRVVSALAYQPVIAIVASKSVSPGAAEQEVVASAAINDIGKAAAKNVIIAIGTCDGQFWCQRHDAGPRQRGYAACEQDISDRIAHQTILDGQVRLAVLE